MRVLRRPLLETGWSSTSGSDWRQGCGGFATRRRTGMVSFTLRWRRWMPAMSRQQPSAAQQHNPAGQRAFEDGQDVIAVEPEFISVKLAGLDAEFWRR